MDSQGFALGILVTEGNASERLGAATVIFYHQQELSETELIWVDGGYSGQNFARAVRKPFGRLRAALCGAGVEVVKRLSDTFEVLPKRWVIERTLRQAQGKLLVGSIAIAVSVKIMKCMLKIVRPRSMVL